MSRAMNVNATTAEIVTMCGTLGVAISAVEALIPSGTRVVCQTSDGALALRKKLKNKVIEGSVVRSPRFVAASSLR